MLALLKDDLQILLCCDHTASHTRDVERDLQCDLSMIKLARFALGFLGLALLLLAGSNARAQAQPSRATRELASRPLGLPQFSMTMGALLLAAAPVVGVGGAIGLSFSGDHFLGCEDPFSGAVDAQCEAEERAHDREVERDMRWLIAGSVTMGVVGIGLIAIGIWRARTIRRAREEVAHFEMADLDLDPRSARLSLRFRF